MTSNVFIPVKRVYNVNTFIYFNRPSREWAKWVSGVSGVNKQTEGTTEWPIQNAIVMRNRSKVNQFFQIHRPLLFSFSCVLFGATSSHFLVGWSVSQSPLLPTCSYHDYVCRIFTLVYVCITCATIHPKKLIQLSKQNWGKFEKNMDIYIV